MKKLESLSLNKFKAYELKKESHNAILGGWIGVTNRSTGATNDNYTDSSKYYNEKAGAWLYPSSDCEKLS